MRLDIRTIAQDGGEKRFQGALDLSGIKLRGETPLPEPCGISGGMERKHGQVTVRFELEYTLRQVCSRCLGRIDQRKLARFEHVVVEKLREDSPEDFAEAPGGILDIGELAFCDMALSLESAPLCREDCRGLCPRCGADRNTVDCGCERVKAVDPRLEALSTLLEEDPAAQCEGMSKGGAEDGSTED